VPIKTQNAASVDIADEQNGGFSIPGHSHIDDVMALEIDFGGASRALKHDDVMFGGQGVIGFFYRRKNIGFVMDIGIHIHIAHGFAQNDDL